MMKFLQKIQIKSSNASAIRKFAFLMLFAMSINAQCDISVPSEKKIKTIENNFSNLPQLKLKDTKGKLRSLKDWEGSFILLNFWATWCTPCRVEIPEFIEYQKTYAEDGLQIIGIGIGEVKRLVHTTNILKINYPVLISKSSKIMNEWGNKSLVIPYSVLISPDGSVLYTHHGLLSSLDFENSIKPFIHRD